MTKPDKFAARFPLIHPDPEVRKELERCKGSLIMELLGLRADYSMAVALAKAFRDRDQWDRLSDRRRYNRYYRRRARRLEATLAYSMFPYSSTWEPPRWINPDDYQNKALNTNRKEDRR